MLNGVQLFMKKLYAPWRAAYAKRIHAQENDTACTFCRIIATKDDSAEFILKRGMHCVTVLNKYPYNAGHLLVVPLMHVAQLHELTSEIRGELMEAVSYAADVVRKTLGAEGHNVGINIGKAAGAGIPEHIHVHVLPRFFGDTNFLPTLADTKQISFDLNEIYATLHDAFALRAGGS